MKDKNGITGPIGTFDYYFNSAIDIANKPRTTVKEVKETKVRGFNCIMVLFDVWANPNGNGAQIFYETGEQKELILKTFVPTKRQYNIFYSITEYEEWIKTEKPSHTWDILNTPKYIHIEYKL